MNDGTVREWNTHQTLIFKNAEEEKRDTVVVARAGTGKTTTMLEACKRFPRGSSIVFLAFNTRIKDEVSRKAPQGVEVRTIHSLGRGALYVFAKGRGRDLPDPSENKTRQSVERLWPAMFEKRGARLVPRDGELVASLCSAAAFAKNVLASTEREVEEIVRRLDLYVGTDERDPSYREVLAQFANHVVALLAEEVRRFRDALEYNFDDMIWLPVVMNLRTKSYDRLVVDEGQDLNACQHELVRRARRRGGRIVLVGDDRQAIYGWRGAEEDGLARFQRELGATTLRLPVTYRCGRAIVDVARTLVPDYEAAPTNGAGSVESCGEATLLRLAEPGDAVISRVNAPLISLCLEFLKAGKRAKVVGRDVGRKILALLAEAEEARAETIPALVAWLVAWREGEVERVEARDGDPTPIHDRADCILALTEGARDLGHVMDRARDLFTDDPNKEDVVLSSTHKAKGLEWRRVFCLQDTYRVGESTEEDNLFYVAVTRAIESLVLVSRRHASTAPAPASSGASEVASEVVSPALDVAVTEAVEEDSPAVEALLAGRTIECWVPRAGENEKEAWRVVG